MKKSRAVVKSDNTDKIMHWLNGTVSEQPTDTQQDGQIEITTELLYKLVCRNYPGLNLPDVKLFQSSLKSEVLSFRAFQLRYIGDSMVSCEFNIGIDPTYACHITGFYVMVNDGNVISKQFNENFKYSVLLELAEEQSDIGQPEEQLEEQLDNEQSNNEQSDSGQSKDENFEYVYSLKNGNMVSVDEVDDIVYKLEALRCLLKYQSITEEEFYIRCDNLIRSYNMLF